MRKEDIKTAFCEECEEFVPYTLSKIKRKHTIRDLTFEVEEYVATCPKCGCTKLGPHEIWAHNLKATYDEYKRRVGLLTSDEIIRIRKKRGMSQVELANFIQCGEKNIARYENGAIQDRVFDLLIRLVDDDNVFRKIEKLNNTLKRNGSIKLKHAQ